MTDRRLLVLIGAARSGTKLVRDCFGRQPGVCVVPYDVNFIWRLGNEGSPHDELPAGAATPRVRRRIERQLARWWREPVLVEKTVSNALRVPYVHALFPEARFVHLIRDGYDVVESSHRQWMASPDWRYLVGKLRSFPPALAPRYMLRAGRVTLVRQLTRQKNPTPPVWGPAYDGIHDDVRNEGVLTAVARQWRRCVEAAVEGLDAVPSEQWVEVRYEDFVQDPFAQLSRLATFCGVDADVVTVNGLDIRTSERGKGRARLTTEELAVIAREIDPLQHALGYG